MVFAADAHQVSEQRLGCGQAAPLDAHKGAAPVGLTGYLAVAAQQVGRHQHLPRPSRRLQQRRIFGVAVELDVGHPRLVFEGHEAREVVLNLLLEGRERVDPHLGTQQPTQVGGYGGRHLPQTLGRRAPDALHVERIEVELERLALDYAGARGRIDDFEDGLHGQTLFGQEAELVGVPCVVAHKRQRRVVEAVEAAVEAARHGHKYFRIIGLRIFHAVSEHCRLDLIVVFHFV